MYRAPVMRLVAREKATMEALYTVWSLDDIIDMNEWLDALEDVGSVA